MYLPNAWVVSAEQDLVTVGRGFTALDLLVLFHQGKRTTMLPIKWEVDARVAGKENE
jgi:hypothetical protein